MNLAELNNCKFVIKAYNPDDGEFLGKYVVSVDEIVGAYDSDDNEIVITGDVSGDQP